MDGVSLWRRGGERSGVLVRSPMIGLSMDCLSTTVSLKFFASLADMKSISIDLVGSLDSSSSWSSTKLSLLVTVYTGTSCQDARDGRGGAEERRGEGESERGSSQLSGRFQGERSTVRCGEDRRRTLSLRAMTSPSGMLARTWSPGLGVASVFDAAL